MGDKAHLEYFNRLLDVNTEGEVIDLFASAYKLTRITSLLRAETFLNLTLTIIITVLVKRICRYRLGAYNAVTGYLQNIKTYTMQTQSIKQF
jgi:hypothetical protein